MSNRDVRPLRGERRRVTLVSIETSLAKGTRLGPCEIGARIGAGGMGEVFRARDSRLGRTVAIKVLPTALAANARFRLRFEQEAKAISSLNHPNICALYDVGRSDGQNYLVMELCEGETLAERLASGPLPIEQVVRFGIEIARALETAHRNGVLHRDLKPSNVMLTKRGVKLLDFGLAVPTAAEEGAIGASDTTRQRVTEAGEIVGTIAYMAPEVLEGGRADARSDLFAFGLILYEMITGERAFDASTKAALIGKVLEANPKPVRDVRPDVPPPIEQLVRQCLARNPDERLESAHDARLQLESVASWGDRQPAPAPASRRRRWILPLAAIAVLLIAAAAWRAGKRGVVPAAPESRPSAFRATIDLSRTAPLALGRFAPATDYFPPLIAVSNDGRTIVYVGAAAGGGTQLFSRSAASFSIAPIEGTRGAFQAFFSPDDRWIGFLAGTSVMKVPAAGGAPVKLAEVTTPLRGSWRSPELIHIITRHVDGLVRIPERGGVPEPVGPRDRRWYSDVLPGSRFALAGGGAEESGDFSSIELVDLESGEGRTIIDRGFDARYVEPGYLTFARSGDLYIAPFDTSRLEVTGEPVLLERGVAMESFWRIAQYAVSPADVLAFVPGSDRSIGKLTWTARDGSTEGPPFPERLYGVVRLSDDQRRLAAEINDVVSFISILDLERGDERRLPVEGISKRPLFTRNGLLFSNAEVRRGEFRIVETDPRGARLRPVRASEGESALLVAASPDAQTLVATLRRGGEFGHYLIERAAGSPPRRMIGGAVSSISPDGKWLAFTSVRTGRTEVWVAPLNDLEAATQVSTNGGLEPLWCAACPDLFFRVGTAWYAARATAEGESLRWDVPRIVWETDFVDTRGISYAVSRDGARLLVSKRTVADVTDRIHAIQGWLALAPGKRTSSSGGA